MSIRRRYENFRFYFYKVTHSYIHTHTHTRRVVNPDLWSTNRTSWPAHTRTPTCAKIEFKQWRHIHTRIASTISKPNKTMICISFVIFLFLFCYRAVRLWLVNQYRCFSSSTMWQKWYDFFINEFFMNHFHGYRVIARVSKKKTAKIPI